VGAIPKLKTQIFPERHMGLVPTPEHDWAAESTDTAAGIAAEYIDLDAVYAQIQDLPRLKFDASDQQPAAGSQESTITSHTVNVENGLPRPRIGIIRDSAFQFYYPENIDALKAAGADIVFTSPLAQNDLPELDALYIGGGFPETHAQQLAENKSFRKALKAKAEDGLPIYAECGGLMYLGHELVLEEKSYSMVGILPVTFDFYARPQGHGYTVVTVENDNPYFEIGTEIRGHEFHYSRVLKWSGDQKDLVFRMKRGVGITKDKDGICYKNVLATYTHIHALGTPHWAPALVRNAITYQQKKAP
jgi:cobyrinic acid a,c-diamide synthase